MSSLIGLINNRMNENDLDDVLKLEINYAGHVIHRYCVSDVLYC